ncbi:sulfotransferase domain-containing protein [Candidatus Poribacteria bacterium]|nr:sulfotransferase domain-containing protein [Candidatus Poribacteria bacterium]
MTAAGGGVIGSVLRAVGVTPPPACLISFPKCGRTWLRLAIGRALQVHFKLEGEGIEEQILKLKKLHRFDFRIPEFLVDHEDNPQFKRPEELTRTKEKFAGTRVIFLVRDPRDVAVSLYFQVSKRLTDAAIASLRQRLAAEGIEDRAKRYEGTMSEFVREPVGSYLTILEYYRAWLSNRRVPKSFLLVRYEDMQKGLEQELARVFDFLEIGGIAPETLSQAAEFTQFDKMRQMEAQGRFDVRAMSPADSADAESFKTRRGVIGGYREYLQAGDIAWMNEKLADPVFAGLGYSGA